MALQIVHYPDPVLLAPSRPVIIIDGEVRDRVAEMFPLMEGADGVGLAAPQVGWGVRLFVLCCPRDDGAEPPEREVYINPEIVSGQGQILAEEGCLSFPGLRVKVARYTQVVVQAQDLSGREFEVCSSGFHARALQHEIDHLAGVVFISRLAPAERIAHQAEIRALEEAWKSAAQRQEA